MRGRFTNHQSLVQTETGAGKWTRWLLDIHAAEGVTGSVVFAGSPSELQEARRTTHTNHSAHGFSFLAWEAWTGMRRLSFSAKRSVHLTESLTKHGPRKEFLAEPVSIGQRSVVRWRCDSGVQGERCTVVKAQTGDARFSYCEHNRYSGAH